MYVQYNEHSKTLCKTFRVYLSSAENTDNNIVKNDLEYVTNNFPKYVNGTIFDRLLCEQVESIGKFINIIQHNQ